MTTGVFRYLDPATITPDTKPWSKVDIDATSFARTERRRSVTDIRSSGETEFGTDISGFSVHLLPAIEKSFTDDTAVREGYYAEVDALLRAKLPAGDKIKKIVIFDHTIRKHDPSSPRQPVQQVHVDQTPGAAAARVRRHVFPPEEAESLLKGRYQIINVWRPIGHPATDFPLAVIDWRTTSTEDKRDLVKVDLLYPLRNRDGDGDDRGKEVLPDLTTIGSTEGYEVKGETYAVQPSERHKFYYVKDMTPDEVMFIKCFDSWSEGQEGGQGRKGIAGLTPHTAFVDPDTPQGTKGRESIEVRCLIFYDSE
ncbi:methyltransferase [Apodospora peruviana]|uniref:Methyltransferase n=1 Tax=Apodospora peruviana TaxID=516989 RepID=A0AAE0IQE0_9PEZI|nr:methyltransferase [Apodospora peruviana]